MNKEYDLGQRGLDYLLRTLGAGRTLSRALAQLVQRQGGRTYTLLPDGVTAAEIYKFDEPLRQIDCQIDRSQAFKAVIRDYSSMDTFVSGISDLVMTETNAVVWAEDYLAHPGDPVLRNASLYEDISLVYFEDTVTYLVRGKVFSASDRSNQVAKRIRSMPIWNGVLLRGLSVGLMNGANASPELVDRILSEMRMVFVMAYRMDGFVFYEPSK